MNASNRLIAEGHARRILIVDDDEDILTAGRLLLRREFAAVLTARNPEALPELLADHEIDVVLARRGRPGVGDLLPLRVIRQRRAFARAPAQQQREAHAGLGVIGMLLDRGEQQVDGLDPFRR